MASSGRGVKVNAAKRNLRAPRETRRAEDRTRALLRLAIDASSDAVLLYDEKDCLVFANRAYAQMFGAEPAAGVHFAELMRAQMTRLLATARGEPAAQPGDAQLIEERLAGYLASRREHLGEREVRMLDGRWVQVRDQHTPDRLTLTRIIDITARKLAEQHSAENAAIFRALFEQAAVGMAKGTLDGRWLEANATLCQMLGYSRDQLLGLSALELSEPEDAAVTRENMRALVSGARAALSREKIYLRKDGSRLWCNLTLNVVHSASAEPEFVIAIIEDISARKAAEAEVRATNERFRSSLEHLGELITVSDADDHIVLANRRFLEFNAPVAEYCVPGAHYSDHLRAGIRLGLFPDAAGREDEWIAERLAMRRQPKGPVERRRQDGRWLLVDDQPLPNGGVVTFGIEITERKQIEEARLKLNSELERRVAERTAAMERAYRELESFSYAISHDLRAPLRSISGFATLLREDEGAKLSAEGLRFLKVMDQSAQHMGRLTDALLDLARTSRQTLNHAPVDMTQLAQAALQAAAGEYPRARAATALLPTAIGDATLLGQVLANLVSNAFKYSSRAPEAEVEIGFEYAARECVYFVRDNGAGFDMTYQDKLFHPFGRLHAEKEFPGTGVGLVVTKMIVERHGGRIWAESRPGAGAVFRFTLAESPGDDRQPPLSVTNP